MRLLTSLVALSREFRLHAVQQLRDAIRTYLLTIATGGSTILDALMTMSPSGVHPDYMSTRKHGWPIGPSHP